MTARSIAPFGNALAGRFWTGNIHCHTNRSDGKAEPEAVVMRYRNAGHDFLCITDHFEDEYGWRITDVTRFDSADFVTLVGAEFSSGPWTMQDCYWVNAIGLDPGFAPPSSGEAPQSVIARAARSGAFMVLLHPGLNNLSLVAALSIEDIDAVEMHNTNMALQFPDAADGRYILDGLLASGRRLLVAAGDDSHGLHQWDSLGNFLRVRAADLTAPSILAALKAGHYYTSQGPTIHDMAIEDGNVVVRSDRVRSIAISGRDWLGTQSIQADSLTEASFAIEAFRGSYFRVTLVDAEGRRCWSNPVFVDAA